MWGLLLSGDSYFGDLLADTIFSFTVRPDVCGLYLHLTGLHSRLLTRLLTNVCLYYFNGRPPAK